MKCGPSKGRLRRCCRWPAPASAGGSHASRPSTDYRFADGLGRIGFINPVTHPFCGDCDRLRLTADGQVRNCLFSIEEWDARRLLRSGGSDQQLAALVRACVDAKKAGHGINSDEFLRPSRAMFQICG